MMEKIFCKACTKEIKTKKERYVHIEDFNCEQLTNQSWWHLKCFTKAMNRDLTILEKQAAAMLNKASVIFNKLPDELKADEEYIIT